MGEIKSSLELAMERTKRVAISEKEKEEIKQKEVLQKATGLFHRYREGHIPLNEILKEIDKMEKKTAITVKELLLSQWIDAISLDDDSDRTFKAIESLKQKTIDEVKQKFYHLLSQYLAEKEKVKEEGPVRHLLLRQERQQALGQGFRRKPGLQGSPQTHHVQRMGWRVRGGDFSRRQRGRRRRLARPDARTPARL